MKWTQIFLISISVVLLIIALVLGLELSRIKKENYLLKQQIETLQKNHEKATEKEPINDDADSEDASMNTSSTISNDSIYPYYHYGLEHHAFGYPFDGDTTDDYILIKPQFKLSYCSQKNVANWVAWELNDTWVGPQERYSGRFITDTALPSHFTRISHDDYTRSGFDRGHLVRSKERTRNEEDNRATFLLTNILPQTPDLNRGVWLRFEDYCLQKATQENKNMYLIAGGIFTTDSTLRGEGKVAIPDSCYKIVVFWPKGLDFRKATRQLEVVAVNMPNIQGVRNHTWQQYATTVRKIEKSTGYDFLALLPDSVEQYVETRLATGLQQ